MNLREEKRYLAEQLKQGRRNINLTYWEQDFPKEHQLEKLKEYAEKKGCVAVVNFGYGWPKGVAIVNLLTHNKE
jgi:hypothetical protein